MSLMTAARNFETHHHCRWKGGGLIRDALCIPSGSFSSSINYNLVNNFGKILHLSMPSFSHLSNADNKSSDRAVAKIKLINVAY